MSVPLIRSVVNEYSTSEIHPLTKTRECASYGALIDNDEDGKATYLGRALCVNSRSLKEITPDYCYTCKKNTLILGQGFNGQGA